MEHSTPYQGQSCGFSMLDTTELAKDSQGRDGVGGESREARTKDQEAEPRPPCPINALTVQEA